MTGSHPEPPIRVELPGEKPAEELEHEHEEVSLIAEEVLPPERLEQLNSATAQFITAENITDLNDAGLKTLQTFESTGTSQASQSSSSSSVRPPEMTLARRRVFVEKSQSAWPRGKDATLDALSVARLRTGSDALHEYYRDKSGVDENVDDITRAQLARAVATYGTSFDEYFKAALPAHATDPRSSHPIDVALRDAHASAAEFLAVIAELDRAVSTEPIDVIGASEAGRQLRDLLGEMQKVFVERNVPLVEAAAYETAASAAALFVGETLGALAENRGVTPRSEVSRGKDLALRLRAVEVLPHQGRQDRLIHARGVKAATEDRIKDANARIDRTHQALASLADDNAVLEAKAESTTGAEQAAAQAELAANAKTEAKLRSDLQDDSSGVNEWKRRLTQITAEIRDMQTALSADAAMLTQIKARVTSPEKGSKFKVWGDAVEGAIAELSRLGLPESDQKELSASLRGLRADVDAEFVRQAKALNAPGNVSLVDVLADGWAYARTLTSLQGSVARLLQRPGKGAAALDEISRRLQLTLAALAGYLSPRVDARCVIELGSSS